VKQFDSVFELYMKILLRENEKYNLTAITDPEEIRQKHFEDSLALLELEEFSSYFDQPSTVHADAVAPQVLDVGSGAGFPGVPLAIAQPGLQVTLLESTAKKANFLTILAEELQLPLKVLCARAEQAAHDPALRESFDLVVSRAVAALPLLCELCLPFVKVGGAFVAYKGRRAQAEEEARSAAQATALLGGDLARIEPVSCQSGERTLIIVRKLSHTPPKYPRNHGAMVKKPL